MNCANYAFKGVVLVLLSIGAAALGITAVDVVTDLFGYDLPTWADFLTRATIALSVLLGASYYLDIGLESIEEAEDESEAAR